MKLNRRYVLAGAAAVTVAGGGLAYQMTGSGKNATRLPTSGLTSAAQAADADLSDLDAAPAIGEMFLGKADAPVTVIEYASATCPHCAEFHEKTYPALKKDYIDTGKVKFIFREFPFDDLALAAFMLARCAPKDKFFPLIDVLFEKQKVWVKREGARAELFKIAQLAGFTEASFDKCLKNQEVANGIIEIQKKGQQQYKVDSTPTFFINGKRLRGNEGIAKFKEMIDAAAG